jgi:hypothetical protein
VVEEGRHDTLVNADGRYGRMWREYTGALKWKISREDAWKENAHV